MTEPSSSDATRLARVSLDGVALTRLSAFQEADRAQAIADLEVENHFAPQAQAGRPAEPGPYALSLSLQEGRLVLDISRIAGDGTRSIVLALGPFRGLMRDYQMMVDSYESAVGEGREARIQAIDMGRRGLHNEGAELLMRRLDGKVALDFATARRLFTLVCLLNQRL